MHSSAAVPHNVQLSNGTARAVSLPISVTTGVWGHICSNCECMRQRRRTADNRFIDPKDGLDRTEVNASKKIGTEAARHSREAQKTDKRCLGCFGPPGLVLRRARKMQHSARGAEITG